MTCSVTQLFVSLKFCDNVFINMYLLLYHLPCICCIPVYINLVTSFVINFYPTYNHLCLHQVLLHYCFQNASLVFILLLSVSCFCLSFTFVSAYALHTTHVLIYNFCLFSYWYVTLWEWQSSQVHPSYLFQYPRLCVYSCTCIEAEACTIVCFPCY